MSNIRTTCEEAERIVSTWPAWKRGLLENSSKPQWDKPRKVIDVNSELQVMTTEIRTLKRGRRFQCGVTTFDCKAGATIRVVKRDVEYRKVLLDFGDRLIDWFHESILDDMEEIQRCGLTENGHA